MRNKNLILLVVLAVLLALIAMPKLLPEKKAYPDQLATIDTAKVQRVHFSKGEETLTLVKDSFGWQVQTEPNWPADDRAMGNILGMLAHLEVASLANSNDDYNHDARYELDDSQALRLEVFEGDAHVLNARLGKASRDYSNSVARLEGEAPIYRMAQNRSNDLPIGRERWLKKELFQLDGATFHQIDLQSEDQISLRNQDSLWVGTRTSKNGRSSSFQLDPKQLEALESNFGTLRFRDLASADQTAKVKEVSPELKVRLKTSDGREVSFDWFRLEEETDVFCQMNSDGPFLIFSGATLESFETLLAEARP
jgi:hypothetical protein